MKLIAYTLLITNFYQCLPTPDLQPLRQLYLSQMSGAPLARLLSSTGAHLGNHNLITIAKTDNNILEGNGKPYVNTNYGIFIENLGDFYKFNNKGKGEKRLEKMVEEGRVKEKESTNGMEPTNSNYIQPDSSTESNGEFDINQIIPLTTTSV